MFSLLEYILFYTDKTEMKDNYIRLIENNLDSIMNKIVFEGENNSYTISKYIKVYIK